MPSPSHLLSDWNAQPHLLFNKCNCLHFIDEDTKPSLIVVPPGTNPLLLTISNGYSYTQSDMYHA